MAAGKDLMVGFLREWVRSKGHAVKSQVTAASGAVNLMQMQDAAKRQYQVRVKPAVGLSARGCQWIIGLMS